MLTKTVKIIRSIIGKLKYISHLNILKYSGRELLTDANTNPPLNNYSIFIILFSYCIHCSSFIVYLSTYECILEHVLRHDVLGVRHQLVNAEIVVCVSPVRCHTRRPIRQTLQTLQIVSEF